MLAYLNKKSLKTKTVSAMKKDIKAEALVQGTYWNPKTGNGCFVGCVIRGSEHSRFESELGIPQALAYLADRLFERLSYADAKTFSIDFLQAIPVGADLKHVADKFALFVLIDTVSGVINFAKKDATKKYIQDVANLIKRKISGEKIDRSVWIELRNSRPSAYASAYADAYAYAYASAYAYAYADASAYADAYASAYAYAYADADASAYAYAYASAYASAYAYAYADASARSRHYVALAAGLISLLRAAGV